MRITVAAAVCLVTPRCAPALREPPPLESAVPSEAGADDSLALAAAAFARRPDPEAVEKAQRLFLEAAAVEAGTAGLAGACRALAWRVEHSNDPAERAALATTGVDTATWCVRRAPDSGECAYRLAIALGQQARERPATSGRGLEAMVAELTRAIALDPWVDDAGPHRVLALVRLRAPGWPLGPGDADAGLDEARRAVALRPDHPPNRAVLAEAFAAAGRRDDARAEWRTARDLARARRDAGDPDAVEWLLEAERALAD